MALGLEWIAVAALTPWNREAFEGDWLVQRPAHKAGVFQGRTSSEIVLANGLLARTFRIEPNLVTTSFEHLSAQENLLRAVLPEAWIELNGKRYAVGGLANQPNRAFLLDSWTGAMPSSTDAFRFVGFETGPIQPRMAWKQVRHAGNTTWPPPGVHLKLHFDPPKGAPECRVTVHYELVDGAPIMSKWFTLENRSGVAIRVNRFVADTLAFVEPESPVDDPRSWLEPNFTVVSNFSFAGMTLGAANHAVRTVLDPDYKTQVNYNLKTPCVLEVGPGLGPDVDVAPKATFESTRAFWVLHGQADRERRGLGVRRLWRTYAPWVTENPIMLHLTSTEPETVRRAIDQASDCGFEMVVISFWSGLDMEDLSEANLAKFKGFREYANSKGVELGGYSLLASRRIDDDNDVINPKTGKTGGAIFGNSPCLGSVWGKAYFEKVRGFMEATGFQLLEHDGNYPGDVCASAKHPGHRGLDDSQWTQHETIAALYRESRAQGVYLNVPDTYFMQGSNKTGMGYRESNWSLPRLQQHLHARQNLFDGTWEKTPSMGWMMTPLVEYQGGGKEATIEPLKEHLADYEQHLANNFGFGAQSCYRGPRLYDSPETKAVVVKWVQWFKKHRAILESDVIHVRRADGRNLDAIVHVNPELETKALLMVFNPTDEPLTQTLRVPLYYSGMRGRVKLKQEAGRERTMSLDAQQRLSIEVTVAPRSRTWFTMR